MMSAHSRSKRGWIPSGPAALEERVKSTNVTSGHFKPIINNRMTTTKTGDTWQGSVVVQIICPLQTSGDIGTRVLSLLARSVRRRTATSLTFCSGAPPWQWRELCGSKRLPLSVAYQTRSYLQAFDATNVDGLRRLSSFISVIMSIFDPPTG